MHEVSDDDYDGGVSEDSRDHMQPTHLTLLDDSVQHQNGPRVLLPSHEPEMAAGVWQRPLKKRS